MFSQFLFSKAFKYLTLRTCSGISARAYGPDTEACSIKWQGGTKQVFQPLSNWPQCDTPSAERFGTYIPLATRCSVCVVRYRLTVKWSLRWCFCYRLNNGVSSLMAAHLPHHTVPQWAPRCRHDCLPSSASRAPAGSTIVAASTGMRKRISIPW